MAYEADKVVVALIADNANFDATAKQSATVYDQSMNKIVGSATKAEKTVVDSHKRMSLAANQNRIGLLELQHVMRGSVDQFASGAPLTQIFAQHVASVGQAASLSAGSLGKFGAIMAGPWGLALTAGVSILATLISKHHEDSDSVESLVAKLKEHAEKTRNSEEADRLWTQTLDGLIDRQHRLNEELGKRLTVQVAVDRNDLAQAQADSEKLEKDLADQGKRLTSAQQQLAKVKATVVTGGDAEEQRAAAIGKAAAVSAAESRVAAVQKKIDDIRAALQNAEGRITRGQIIIGEQEGQALADLSAKAKLFADNYTAVLRTIEQDNPTLTIFAASINGAADSLTKAASEAASAGVDFAGVTNKVTGLDRRLNLGQISVKTYATEIAKLTKQLEEMTEAAKEAAKHKIDPVTQFKQSVIGAEGTGPNKLGSSAAGFGQFMPSTWLSYFNNLFPDKAALSDAAKLNFRNIRTVAEAVIDKATDDYKAVLKSAGQQLTAANLYAVHLLGSKDAKKLFAAAPGTATSQFLSPQVLSGNPFLKGTAGTAMAAISKRIGDSSRAVSQGAAAIVQQLEQEKERLRQFQNARASLEDDVLNSRRDMGLSAAEIALIEHTAVEAARQKYENNVKALEDEGKYTKDEAAELIKLNDERAKLRNEIVERRRQEAEFREQEARNENALNVQTGLLDAQKDVLRSEEQLARTGRERKDIEDRLIDIQFEEEKMRLLAQISLADRLKAEAERTKSAQDLAAAERAEADAALARQKLQNLPQQQANAHSANAQSNASPLQAYFDSIPNTAAEINDAFEHIAANGLATFNDALANAIVNFTSLSDVARTVLGQLATDLIKFALQQIELHTIGAALSAASVATTTAAAAAAGAAWAGPAALASLATLGTNAGPAAAAIASTVGLATILGAAKAGGGRIFGPGSDTSDNILTPMSPGEFAIKASSARNLGYDTLDYINQHGQLPPRTISPSNAQAASPGRGGFSPGDMSKLEGIVSRAIEAMPGIALYPTLHPADALDAALSSRAGQRKMFDFFGANATHINTQLRRPGS